jgi:two-component system, NtrC family, nitrogen regulation response regulator NtrX
VRSGVVVSGERGSGREMVARAIHSASCQPQGQFVKVDCTRLVEAELGAELFGAAPDASPDGWQARAALERLSCESKILKAVNGTLLITGLGEMPARVQAAMVRILRDREAVILENGTQVPVDVRVVAAVEPAFEVAVDEGRLRPDLFERLATIRIDVPPLRRRKEDIPALAKHFLSESCRRLSIPRKTLTPSALTLLSALPWRGNALELRGVLEALAMLVSREVLDLSDVLSHVRLDGDQPRGAAGATLRQARATFEREFISNTLQQHQWRIPEAARALGLQRTNLYRKMRSLGVTRRGTA